MNARTSVLASFTACGLAAVAAAQTNKVVPPFYTSVEGNSRYTYPFGRDQTAMQILIDGNQLTASTAVLTAIAFRPEGSTTTAYTGYTKTYKLTVWTTPITAANMTTDPVANAANTSATVAFNAVVNVPTAPVLPQLPAPFTLRLPFASGPYPFDTTQGNLLLQIDTADTVAPPGSWVVDAASLRTTTVEGLVSLVADGCKNGGGDELTLTVGRSNAVVGGSLDFALKASRAGAFPTAVAIVGTRTVPRVDLGVVGMPGCGLAIDVLLTRAVQEVGGMHPTVSWPIPPLPHLQGAALHGQALGWANPPNTLAGSVTSDASAVVIGPSGGGWKVDAQSIFYVPSTSRWSMGANVAFFPVVSVEGVFP